MLNSLVLRCVNADKSSDACYFHSSHPHKPDNYVNCTVPQVGALATPILMASLAAPFFAYVTFGDIHSSKKALRTALIIGTPPFPPCPDLSC
jgi:hypothetical protein